MILFNCFTGQLLGLDTRERAFFRQDDGADFIRIDGTCAKALCVKFLGDLVQDSAFR